jgi:hypothetical protein
MDSQTMEDYERLKILEQKYLALIEQRDNLVKKSKKRPEYILYQKNYNREYYQKNKVKIILPEIPKETLLKII